MRLDNRLALVVVAALASCSSRTEVGSNRLPLTDAARPADAFVAPACVDNVDNDDDGLQDYPFEPGCEGPEDDDETDPAPLPACFNESDDDGDGIVDFPVEPGCVAASDPDETDPSEPAECSDGIDNDGDGDIDYPADDGCISAGGGVESEITN